MNDVEREADSFLMDREGVDREEVAGVGVRVEVELEIETVSMDMVEIERNNRSIDSDRNE
jgi:hypothetical protein